MRRSSRCTGAQWRRGRTEPGTLEQGGASGRSPSSCVHRYTIWDRRDPQVPLSGDSHPGEILREDYLEPLGLGANALAKALGVTAARINDVVRERRGVTAHTAIRLARYFGGDARSRLNLQMAYDLRVAELESAKDLSRQVKPRASSRA